ncbi:MAG: hypothetical protein HY322_04520 [Betaproteobacteria bacterium]|nr:hypothetical protein [Betaproteobacteria bacterium]
MTRILVTPLPVDQMKDDAPWANLTVKPALGPIMSDDPERGIGKRIAYCRGQLDNLSFEALARYVRCFDRKGIATTSLMRYESGEYLPGARELRILSDTFWVPPKWLLFGTVDHDLMVPGSTSLLDGLRQFILTVTESGIPVGDPQFVQRYQDIERDARRADQERRLIARRQQWLWEARGKTRP